MSTFTFTTLTAALLLLVVLYLYEVKNNPKKKQRKSFLSTAKKVRSPTTNQQQQSRTSSMKDRSRFHTRRSLNRYDTHHPCHATEFLHFRRHHSSYRSPRWFRSSLSHSLNEKRYQDRLFLEYALDEAEEISLRDPC